MYDELVKRLRDKAGAFDYDGRPDIACDYEQAANAIEELQSDNAALNGTVSNLIQQIAELSKPRWIPVAERLPEKYTPVLVCYRSYHTGEPMADCNAYIDDDGDWCWYDGFPATGEMVTVPITHWTPLPEPPKEDA